MMVVLVVLTIVHGDGVGVCGGAGDGDGVGGGGEGDVVGGGVHT